MSDVSVQPETESLPPLRILAIDGGGIRGIIAAVVLADLERRIKEKHGKALHEVFDFFAGTSTGGLILSSLCAMTPDGQVRPVTASDIRDAFVDDGARMFPSSFADKFFTGFGWVRRKYDHRPLERFAKKRVGEARLKDVAVELLMTSYDLHSGRPYFFKRWCARETPEKRDHALWQAVRSTSAAPTYFEPYNLVGDDGNHTELYNRSLIDGGMIANNPAMCAYAEAKKFLSKSPPPKNGHDPRKFLNFDPDERDGILMVSLGTGDVDTALDKTGVQIHLRKYQHAKARLWPKPLWAQPAITASMDGVADTVGHQMNHVLVGEDQAAREGLAQTYFRFQTHVNEATKDMDVATKTSIEALVILGDKLVKAKKDELERLAIALD